MKKVLALILCFCLVLCLGACGKSEGNTASGGSGEIDRYAKKGEIPELNVSLGESIADFHEKYPPDSEGADETKVLLFEEEGNISVCLGTLNAYYYYEKDKKDNGISAIAVTTGDVFGLSLGSVTTKSDVTALLAAEYTESVATQERQFFLYAPIDNCKMLTAQFDNIRVDFFFVEDFLTAVTLVDTANWTA